MAKFQESRLKEPGDPEKLRVPSTRFHKILNALSLFLLFFMFFYIALKWSSLPETIPTHWNMKGTIDGWGSRTTLFICPVIAFFMYFLMLGVGHFPSAWNVPVKITSANRDWVYRNVKNLLVVTNLVIMLIFSYLTYRTVQGQALDSFFLPVSLAALFVPMIFFLRRCGKLPPEEEKNADDFDVF